MIIENHQDLSQTDLRRHALEIIDTGITAVTPQMVMKSSMNYEPLTKDFSIKFSRYNLSTGRIFVIGGGKAAGAMAETLEQIIPPEDITAGIVICNSSDYKLEKIKLIEAGHPVPDERAVGGVEEILALKEKYEINEQDHIISLISGGGSALMTAPVEPVTLENTQRITEQLIKCGPTIQEINTIRKHISKIKGGQLGKYFSPTKIITIIISDVVGNDVSSIASGPTAPDMTTFEDAYNILKKYKLLTNTPKHIKKYIKNNMGNGKNETPKILENCNNYIIADSQLALNNMAQKAKDLGYKPLIVTFEQTGEPEKVAQDRVNEILENKYSGFDVLLFAGETTPSLPKYTGVGGRNQHYVAKSLLAMSEYCGDWCLASLSTEGADYLPDVAGAVIDNDTLNAAVAEGLDVQSYIDNFDSNTLLDQLGNSIIKTGNTGTNVGDITIYIIKQ